MKQVRFADKNDILKSIAFFEKDLRVCPFLYRVNRQVDIPDILSRLKLSSMVNFMRFFNDSERLHESNFALTAVGKNDFILFLQPPLPARHFFLNKSTARHSAAQNKRLITGR
ncbi:MAG TPA: hypothetical protein PLR20_11160 [Syntrophales bacterium]|nr:hypothetical protein [Syntrophales bacterium]HOX94143.1 hypothetical protein [Syntrophales bacterium]HPN25417.1 hypothetical protein [Syntrophales bacterium]HQM29899.1 hypothetical protein [Syntrophales bacterium]